MIGPENTMEMNSPEESKYCCRENCLNSNTTTRASTVYKSILLVPCYYKCASLYKNTYTHIKTGPLLIIERCIFIYPFCRETQNSCNREYPYHSTIIKKIKIVLIDLAVQELPPGRRYGDELKEL